MIVYKITNTTCGKSYIGYTKQSLEVRWKQHYKQALKEGKNRKFYNAIKKYGIDCWSLEVIETVSCAKEAKEREIFYIQYYDTYANGYNATLGGDGNNGIIMSQQSNKARSEKLKGIKKSPETIKKFRERKQTDITKNKISKKHLGMKKPWVKWTPDQCRKRGLTRRAITKDQYDLIHQLKCDNLKIKEIADLANLSTDLVKKWLKMDW